MKAKVLIAIMVMSVVVHLSGQDETSLFSPGVDVAKMPGYVDLSDVKIPKNAENVTEISLGLPLLNLLKHTAHADDGMAGSLTGIFTIQVKSFEVHRRDREMLEPIVKKIEKQLEKDQWQRILYSKDGDEISVITIKHDKGKPAGLFIMSYIPEKEVSFVNFVGQIDLNKIGALNFGFNNSALDSLRDKFSDDDDWDDIHDDDD